MGGNDQQLFLAEFLVDNVRVPNVCAVFAETIPATTCVAFQILNLPPINITQDASVDNCNCIQDDAQIFKKGKSCLFALPTMVLEKPLSTFPITMSVYKKLPPGVLPDVMLIGTRQIETKDLVNDLLSRHVFKAGNPCKSIKEAFKIKTATGQHVGEVTVFLRLSCLGAKIVTQFQIPHDEKPYLFKGADDSPIFQCKRITSDSEQRAAAPIKCSCEPTDSRKSSKGEGEKRRTCCPTPPTCPPTRRRSSQKLAPRPCCPSSRRG